MPGVQHGSCLLVPERIKICCGIARKQKQYGNLRLSTVTAGDPSIIMPS